MLPPPRGEFPAAFAELAEGHPRVTLIANSFGETLTVMERGEHWIHTDAQLAVLDAWLTRKSRDR